MAFLTDTRSRDAGVIARTAYRLVHWFADASETFARRRMARITYTELSSLTDRELDDLGLSRSEIRRVAQEVAQGKI